MEKPNRISRNPGVGLPLEYSACMQRQIRGEAGLGTFGMPPRRRGEIDRTLEGTKLNPGFPSSALMRQISSLSLVELSRAMMLIPWVPLGVHRVECFANLMRLSTFPRPFSASTGPVGSDHG
jgi:hypothetical protein